VWPEEIMHLLFSAVKKQQAQPEMRELPARRLRPGNPAEQQLTTEMRRDLDDLFGSARPNALAPPQQAELEMRQDLKNVVGGNEESREVTSRSFFEWIQSTEP
jgi:hypothetical protein